MARNTVGSGSNWVEFASYSALQSTAFSVSLWYRVVTASIGVGDVVLAYDGTWPGGNWAISYAAGPTLHFLAMRWDATLGEWSWSGGSNDAWHHLGLTYSFSSTANTPVAYLDGVAQTVSVVGAPVGSAGAWSANPLRLGDNGYGSAVWGGDVGGVGVYNRALASNELLSLAFCSPWHHPSGLVLESAILGQSPEPNRCVAAGGVVTGTTVVAPSARQVRVGQAWSPYADPRGNVPLNPWVVARRPEEREGLLQPPLVREAIVVP